MPHSDFLRLFVFCLPALLGLVSCSKRAAETPDVIVLQTGRLRGNVYPLELQAAAPLQHWQFLAGYVKAVREEAARSEAGVVLIDLGDSLTGSFAAHVTGSENVAALFNGLEYDAIALSNLDSAASPELLRTIEAPVVNPFADTGGEPATKGTTFATSFAKPGAHVSLLSNFYGDTSAGQHPDRFPAWFGTTPSDVLPVRDYGGVVESLPPKAAGDLRLLTWMKFESPTEPPSAFLEMLRGLGVDMVLAHRIYGGGRRDVWSQDPLVPWEPPVSVNILRNNGGFTVARTDLKRDGTSWRVLRNELVPMTANTAVADSEFISVIARFAPAIAAADRKLADLTAPMKQEQILGAYMAALAMVPGTDAALYSSQSIRSDWPAGELRASQVFNSLPWTTPIVQMELTPAQLAEAAEVFGMRYTTKPGADGELLTVTTSKFFADLIRRSLSLDQLPAAIGVDSEFDYFVAKLQSTPQVLAASADTWGGNP